MTSPARLEGGAGRRRRGCTSRTGADRERSMAKSVGQALEGSPAPAPRAAPRASSGSATARGESARATREAARSARQDCLRRGPSEEREPGVIAVERERCGARVPAREVHLDAVEAEDPALGDAERDRPRQEPMERVGWHALEPVLLGALEELLEAAHARQELYAPPRAVGHGA